MGRQRTTTGVNSLKYGLQMTASVWMPFNQTCEEESGDADFDSFKTAPWDSGGGGHNGTKYMNRCAEQGYITLTD